MKLGFTRKRDTVFFAKPDVRIEVPREMLHTFKEVFMDDTYLRGFDDVLLNEPVIFDIGANVGYFSLFAAAKFPGAQIYSFEPIPGNFSLLETQCASNLQHSITPFQMAVAGECGSISMEYNAADAFSTTASIHADNHDQNHDHIKVECLDLPAACHKAGVEKIDFLIMDCEGAEHDILRSCPRGLLQSIQYIAMEIHPDPDNCSNSEGVCVQLRELGFTVSMATCTDKDALEGRDHPFVWASRV